MADETTTTGPGLTYTSAASAGTWTTTPVDHQAVANPRDRAICRALLKHALTLLDAAEAEDKRNPVGFEA